MRLSLARRPLLATAGAVAAAGQIHHATAAGTTAPAQVPGIYRTRIGEAVVTALLDGFIDILPEWWVGLSPEELRAGLAAAFLPAERPLRISVNAWMVTQAGRRVLIDAGSATLFGPSAGRFAANLGAAGFGAGSVDAVLLTHLHPDHIGGLIADGRAVFPRATVHVAEAELRYWTDPAARAAAPAAAQPWFDAVAQLRHLYGARLIPFAAGAEPVPGFRAVPLPGHTPGHTGFILQSGGEALFFWADTTDSTALQLNHPERTLVFDVDRQAGARSRRLAIEMAAAERLPVAGSHIPFPGLGHVAREDGSYRFLPAEWQHEV